MDKYNDALDKAADELINKAADVANERDGSSLTLPDEDIVFSKEHELKMKKLFDREKRKAARKRFWKYSQRAACIFLAFTVISAAAVFSVSAWRVKFLNFVLERGQPNTDYNFSDDGGTTYTDDKITLGYVPMGFEITDGNSTRESLLLVFTNEQDYFQVGVNSPDVNFSIDTEDGTAEKIKINGCEGVYTTNKNINALIWHNDKFVFSVVGNIPKDEIIKIAEKIKK